MNESQARQKILILYLGNSNLDSAVVGWSLYDGTSNVEFDPVGNEDPPYKSVLEAMRDGWRVIQIPAINTPQIGREHQTDYLQFEFVLERMEVLDG